MSTLDAATQRFLAQYSDAAEALDGGDLRGSWHGSFSRPVMLLTIGSLFSGYGGLDRAVEEVFGARTAWVSDIDKGACKVLAHRYPDAPNLGDITAIDWATVPRVDIITGGSPCQDLSHAGRRAGMTEGTRSNLWVSMREAIATIKPSFVVWENVQGALSAEAASELEHCPGCMGGTEHGGPVLRALGRVLGDLADLGFDAEWYGLPASDLGACHRRFRVFVLAYAHGARLDLTLLPTPTVSDTNGADAHGTGGADPRTTVALLPTPRATRGGSTTEQAYALGGVRDDSDRAQGRVLLPTPSASVANDGEGTDTWLARRELVKLTAANGNGMGMPLTIAVQLLPTPSVVDGNGGPKRIREDGRTEADHGPALRDVAAALSRWGEYTPAIARHEQAWGAPAPEPTEPGPKGNPRLSAAFCEWMMMQPAGWITDTPGVTRNEALKLCGNGVVTPQAEHALRVMLARLDLTGWRTA